MVSTKKPEIVVFAGPNGSGKSTFTEVLRPLMDYINADEIRKNLKCGELEAAQLAERQREERLAARRDFCFETVLSTPRNLRLLKRAKQTGYFTRGCTALLDAVGGAIHYIRTVHKYARPEDRPARTMFVITTDGLENASAQYTADQVRAMVKRQEEKAGWEFIFLGANIDAVQAAGGLGIRAKNAVEFSCDAAGIRENFQTLSCMTSMFVGTGVVADGWQEKIRDHLAKRKSGRR